MSQALSGVIEIFIIVDGEMGGWASSGGASPSEKRGSNEANKQN